MVRKLLGVSLAAAVTAQDLFLSPKELSDPNRFDWGDNESPLDTYMNKEDPHYSWFDTGERVSMPLGGTGYVLNVTSQSWKEGEAWVQHDGYQTSIWSHQVMVIVPDNLKIRNKAVIYNTGACNEHPGTPKGTDEEPLAMNAVSSQIGVITVALFQIPNCHMIYATDPSKRGRSEDAMLAWAWKNFMDTGDHEWLPRLPMAKAVMKAMQAVQEYTTQESIAEIDAWLVSGASKRGWTTWMVGAAASQCTWCPKVEALAPIVPIVPDLRNGVHHMWRAYGGFTFAFNDYTDVNFTTQIDDAGTIELFKVVDPMAYISRLNKMPKTVICSSDDEFMMMEWTANWFDEFAKGGEMNLWIGANVEHSMATGIVGLERTLGNFANSVFLGGQRPTFSHVLDKVNGEITVTIPEGVEHGKVVLRHGHTLSTKIRDFRWIAGATKDKDGNATCVVPRVGPYHTLGSDVCFQPIIWEGTTLNATSPGVYTAKLQKPLLGWIGAFVEIYFPSDTGLKTEYQLTTPGMVWPQTLPYDECHGEECVGHLL